MADAKATALSEVTTPTKDDLLYIVDSPGSSPASGKVKLETIGNGWVGVADTWTYASTTTITVPTGAASIYAVGDKIKMTNSGTKYNYIVAVADTLLTVRGNGVANAAITSPSYSKVLNPLGFPQYFAYTPTGVSASNVTLSGRFALFGRMCKADVYATFTGAITFTTMPTLPITASGSILWGSVVYSPMGSGGYYDASVGAVPNGVYPSMIASATTVTVSRSTDGAAMSATVPITWANGDAFMVSFTYEI